MSDVTLKTEHTWEPAFGRTCAALLAAGLIGMLIIYFIFPIFAYAELPEVPNQPTDAHLELIQEHIQARGEFYSRNYAVGFGILGGCIGACAGFVTVDFRRFQSLMAGAVLGGIGGAIAGFIAGVPVGQAIETSKGFSLGEASIHQISTWSAITVGWILGIGLVQSGPFHAMKAAATGLIAAVIAAVTYLAIASFLFLNDSLTYVIPESLTHRIFWICTYSLVVAGILAMGMRPSQSKLSTEAVAESPDEA